MKKIFLTAFLSIIIVQTTFSQWCDYIALPPKKISFSESLNFLKHGVNYSLKYKKDFLFSEEEYLKSFYEAGKLAIESVEWTINQSSEYSIIVFYENMSTEDTNNARISIKARVVSTLNDDAMSNDFDIFDNISATSIITVPKGNSERIRLVTQQNVHSVASNLKRVLFQKSIEKTDPEPRDIIQH